MRIDAAVFAAVLGLVSAGMAGAAVVQEAEVRFVSLGGAEDFDSDAETAATSAEIQRTLLAQISQTFTYSASTSVSQFGTFGMQAFQATSGSLETAVRIRSDENVNRGGPARAFTNFIIDGGRISMEAAPGATISYELTLINWNGTSFPGFPFPQDEAFFIPFQSRGTLTSLAFGQNSFVLDPLADDIGATLDAAGRTLDIPLSLQRVDLGLIRPGEVLDLEYSMRIFSDITGVEGAGWTFSDPLTILPPGSEFFPGAAVEFVPVDVAAVPLPPALPLLAVAVGTLSLRRRRRPR